MDAAVAFGRVLRKLRLEAKLTQEELGFEAELRRTYVSILELGQQQPSLTTVLKLSEALGRPAHEVIGLVESELASAKSKKPSRK